MPKTTLTVPRIVPQFGRDGRPAWYVVEAPDGTRIDYPCGLNVIGGRLDTEDDTPGQATVHINTERLAPSDVYDEGNPKLHVSVNDADLFDDQGRGNVAEPVELEIPIYAVQTSEGPYLFVDEAQAAAYADLGGYELETVRLWGRAEGAQRLRDAREDAGEDLADEKVAA